MSRLWFAHFQVYEKHQRLSCILDHGFVRSASYGQAIWNPYIIPNPLSSWHAVARIHPEVIQSIAHQYRKQLIADHIKNMPWKEKCNWIRCNPLTAAQQFKHRLNMSSLWKGSPNWWASGLHDMYWVPGHRFSICTHHPLDKGCTETWHEQWWRKCCLYQPSPKVPFRGRREWIETACPLCAEACTLGNMLKWEIMQIPVPPLPLCWNCDCSRSWCRWPIGCRTSDQNQNTNLLQTMHPQLYQGVVKLMKSGKQVVL